MEGGKQMNPGEIYTAPDGRKYMAEKEKFKGSCNGCSFTLHDKNCDGVACYDTIFVSLPTVTYTLIESLRTGKSWPGGMPDSNSFHEGAKAMAMHLGYEVEGHAKYPCADCGHPVTHGYCCELCGSVDPSRKRNEE